MTQIFDAPLVSEEALIMEKYIVEISRDTGFERSIRDGGEYPSLDAALSAMERFPLSCFESFCVYAVNGENSSLAYEMT